MSIEIFKKHLDFFGKVYYIIKKGCERLGAFCAFRRFALNASCYSQTKRFVFVHNC